MNKQATAMMKVKINPMPTKMFKKAENRLLLSTLDDLRKRKDLLTGALTGHFGHGAATVYAAERYPVRTDGRLERERRMHRKQGYPQ